ncbi:lytic polysaccharide monooxygenase [Karstenula rhodostoma CBS 690.94]|uniref:Lytic polysaccharide monooxygenase n=1 Tax=Karstenula rhodostoma CBS 690.94 TaxID=1392251 RepID=A0A9P4UFE5_9PLEO|nr:lytic polysaccharide monooxygenase [Karstenula rhodostoma CBS 690.94]
MRLPPTTTTLLISFLVPTTSAHGRITNITTPSGAVYQGWDPASTGPQNLTAWRAANLGNIFVKPSQFNTSHIACHYDATPGALHIPTAPGDVLNLQWNEWPASHKGPVLTYLAACPGSCAEAAKETLAWVKIDEVGWLNSSGADVLPLGGTWGSDVLRANAASWTVKVPEVLGEGSYVLRHEIVALHVAEEVDGAQAYPQCVNLRVASSAGGEARKLEGGVVGNKLYGMRDKGVLVDIHGNVTGYENPGPKVWEFATRIKQPNQ